MERNSIMVSNERDITDRSYEKHCDLGNLLDAVKYKELTILYLIDKDSDDFDEDCRI
jgi:hypothetical protein